MGMVTCPNCGKDTFDDEKCVYCNHPLKKRENPFDMEKYQYIKAEYLKTNNKAAAIKSGMKQFGISMQEAKEIADFIADEIYEDNNIRSKEQVASLLNEDEPKEVREEREAYNIKVYKSKKNARILFPILFVVFAVLIVKTHLAFESRTPVMICIVAFIASMVGTAYGTFSKQPKMKDYYRFSLMAYFIHVFLYQLIAEVVLVWAILLCRDHGIIKEYPLVLLVWGILEVLLFMNILFKWGETCTIYFSTEPGNYMYGYNLPVRKAHRNGKKTNRIYAIYYQIRTITKIEEHMHSFVIYGTIIKGGGPRQHRPSSVHGKQTQIEKVKIPKCFQNNKELLEKLKK